MVYGRLSCALRAAHRQVIYSPSRVASGPQTQPIPLIHFVLGGIFIFIIILVCIYQNGGWQISPSYAPN